MAASTTTRTVPRGFVTGIPLVLLCTGIALRYAAAVHSIQDKDADFLLFDSLCRWDCVWYLNIAEHGYDPFPNEKANNVGNWGFFPLYPAVVAVVGVLSPLTTLQTASLCSLALTYLSCLVMWPLVSHSRRAYILCCTYFLAGPFSFHMATSLSESLFVLLTVLAMLGLQRKDFLATGLAGAFLSATRIVGVFMVFATAIEILRQYRREGGKLLGFPAHVLGRPDLLLAILISPLGLFVYMLLLIVVVGDGFAFSHVQRAFGRQVDWPWLHWWDAANYASKTSWWPTPSQWSAAFVLLGLGLSALIASRRQYGLAMFCLIAILLPLSAGMASMVRYIGALAPIVVTVASVVATRRLATVATVGLFLALCYFFTRQWIGGYLALV